MKLLTIDQLDDLARGAAILGSGGGGAPSYNRLMTEEMMELHGPIRLLSLEDLKDDDFVVPVAFMGAPLVAMERIPTGREFSAIFSKMERYPTVVMPAEIGGGNAFTPLWVAAKLGLPVLDGDTIGRAFPELQMSTCTLAGVKSSPAYLADGWGNVVRIDCEDPFKVETLARNITIGMGSRAAIAIYSMNGKQAKESVVSGTISQAIMYGKKIVGKKLVSGVIVDVDHRIAGGFLKGICCLRSEEGDYFFDYQNEFLRVRTKERAVALTPDIITLMEQDTGIPIATNALKYGLRVDVIIVDAPAIWKTPKGMDLVGPKKFGYEENV